MAEASKQEIKLFYCYAREDRDLRDQFEKSLAGQEWEKAIAEQLKSADIIFLPISSDFMASDYCYGIEMQHALERHAEGSCLVIPILLRPTHWEGEPFGKLQLLPTDARPITRWSDRDDAFQDVVKEVSKVIKTLPIHKSKEEWLEEGLSHYKANRFREAITAYTQAIRRDRNYALAYHYQGEANYCLNNFAEALADFEIALSIDPLLLCAYTWKGNTLSRLNQTRKAIIAYAEGLIIADKTPQDQWNAQFYYDKSQAFYGLKFYTEALIDCDQAIHLDPNYASAYDSKGNALGNLSRYEEALTAFDQAIRLEPNLVLASAYYNKGYVPRSVGKTKEAEQAFEKARQLGYNG